MKYAVFFCFFEVNHYTYSHVYVYNVKSFISLVYSMVKKVKYVKNIANNEQKTSEIDKQKSNISDLFLDEISSTFTKFDKMPEAKRIELYGDQEYIEQFWEFFKKEHPNLLDKIDKKDLPLYLEAIEDRGFTVANIKENTGKLHREFADEHTELHVMEQSITDLKDFCEDKVNAMPSRVWEEFAEKAWFDKNSCKIFSDGKLKTIDDLRILWKQFTETKTITLSWDWASKDVRLKDYHVESIEKILNPNYNPTERIMVMVATNKIREELKWSLRTEFDKQFPLNVDAFSDCQNLLTFKDELSFFLWEHASEIDESLAKKLDSVIVTNGDIQREFLKSGRKFDDTKWFSEWEKYFRRIFNKLVTRQLFEEVKNVGQTVDRYLENIWATFMQFPPYVNKILEIHQFNAKHISAVDSSFNADLQSMDEQSLDLQQQYVVASTDEEKRLLRKKIRELNEQKEYRKWQWYIAFLRTKEPQVADVFSLLVANKFNFSVLSSDQQQFLVDVLVKEKLEDTIKNNIPSVLSVSEWELTQFVRDLFDLRKKDIVIPTRHGPVSLTFLKKEFISSVQKQLPAINDLEEIKNLPLNFETQITEANANFFEDSSIFDSLYYDFTARNGKFRINDAYKVKVTKEGKVAEWYLSSYSPIDERNLEKDHDGKELYLYSEPITAPNQERTLVTREWTDTGTPVVIKHDDQQNCAIEVVDKKINLNGDAFGALLFGYVLGEQSMNTSLSPEKEKALAEKLGTLDTYKDKEDADTEVSEQEKKHDEQAPEVSEKQKFLESWKSLAWYGFPEEQYKDNWWFVQWSRLFLPFADSDVPPVETGKQWMQMEIIAINETKWTFSVKLHWGESLLWKYEWQTKELSMNKSSLDGIVSTFGTNIYKLPPNGWSFDKWMNVLSSWGVVSGLEKSFGWLKFDGSKFVHSLWEYSGKTITHFGVYQPKAIDEAVDQESWKTILYKITCNSDGTITVSGDKNAYNYAKNFPSRKMDYATFMLFIQEKKLQPKCEEQIKDIYTTKKAQEEETPTTIKWFSISNVIWVFKNTISKVKDWIKKFDEERTDDLMNLVTNEGLLYSRIGQMLPFSRMAAWFENVGVDYFLERDSRIWKKVEKRTKHFEDFDYTKLYVTVIKPMLDGQIEVTPHYKMAALLLVNIKKAKWPYGKHPSFSNEGKWVGKLLGNDHQQRYLAMREKRIRDLEENAKSHWGPWADQVKNELVELEMRYIVHVMDGRHMWINDGDKTKYYFQSKYSKKFCDELEWAYTSFYKQDWVEEWFGKNKDVNFEFARAEYFRQLADRPQQALPMLKVMATKAINDNQRQVFEMAVLAWILSGVFLTMTFASTQSFIQKICRTRWFVPWIFAKDVEQQTKVQRLLDLFSGGEFTKKTSYSAANFSYRNNIWAWGFIKTFASWTQGNISIGKETKPVMNSLSKFFALTGVNTSNKTLLDVYADPKLSLSDKLLLEEFIGKTNEKDESLDNDVVNNTSSLTWSILTKSQSVVEKMIKIDKWGFAGKDGDDIQNMKAFSENMQKAIPTGKESVESVNFFIEKFFNWFGDKGFSGNKKTEFIKRLKRCKEHKWSEEVDDVLYYSIVWEIVNSLASHDSNPPDELLGALWAWKDFFKNNIDTILQPSIISSTFGGPQYIHDFNKYSPFLESWDTAAVLLDREDSIMYMQTLDKDQRQQALAQKRQITNNKQCLNKDMYKLAEDLSRKCSWFSNRFKRDVHTQKKADSFASIPSKSTWAKIKNAQVVDKVRRILENKPIDDDINNNNNDYIPMSDDDYFDMST